MLAERRRECVAVTVGRELDLEVSVEVKWPRQPFLLPAKSKNQLHSVSVSFTLLSPICMSTFESNKQVRV
jgi:hypothetical protein